MISVTLDLHTLGESNARDHWRRKAARVAQHRGITRMAVAARLCEHRLFPCRVTLARIAPRTLDSDNLQSACKAVRDGVADAMGVHDNDPRITWDYAQERGKPRTYAVRIEIQPREPVPQ